MNEDKFPSLKGKEEFRTYTHCQGCGTDHIASYDAEDVEEFCLDKQKVKSAIDRMENIGFKAKKVLKKELGL